MHRRPWLVICAVIGAMAVLLAAMALWLAALVAPAYALGLFAGSRAFHLASPEVFRRLCFALIAASVLTSLPLWR